MKWGIITDTHDKVNLVKKAIEVFEGEGCSHVFHCGDFETNKVLERFLNRSFKFSYVTDHDGKHDRRLKDKYRKDFLTKKISGAQVALYHSTYSECVHRVRGRMEPFGVKVAIAEKQYDFVFYGHLHFFNVKLPSSDNATIALNSGGFYHDELSTFCIIDLEAAALDLYYWRKDRFLRIVRFPLDKTFRDLTIVDREGAFDYAQALGQLTLNASDRCGHTFSDDDSSWFNKNFVVLFKMTGYENRPAFFYQIEKS